MKLLMIKTYFTLSSVLNPEKAAKQSFDLFQKVRKKEVRRREVPFYQETRHFKVSSGKEPIHCFEMGDPNGPLVFLVHGWDSNAGSLSMFASRFADLGYRVIAFNLPGHAYYQSASTNLIECRDAMRDVVDFIDPKEPFSVVSHSFGSAVAANAFANSERQIDKMVFLTNPNRMEDIFEEFKEMIGLTRRAYRFLVKNTAQLVGGPVEMLDVSTNLKKVNFDKLLLIHDMDDQVLPYANSFAINSDHQNVQLIRMEKIGHYKMLWNDEVIGRTTAFVAGKEVY
ncbi:MAG: alpha/beta hydrolase [Crocinitomicaceae bacterium]